MCIQCFQIEQLWILLSPIFLRLETAGEHDTISYCQLEPRLSLLRMSVLNLGKDLVEFDDILNYGAGGGQVRPRRAASVHLPRPTQRTRTFTRCNCSDQSPPLELRTVEMLCRAHVRIYADVPRRRWINLTIV